MKRLFLVLILLLIAVPANATIKFYNGYFTGQTSDWTGTTPGYIVGIDITQNCRFKGDNSTVFDSLPCVPLAITGADPYLVTGTAGTSGNCAEWNVDGDLVDAGAVCGVGGGASQLSDLSDVTSAGTTNRYALLANGSTYVGRALTYADISDIAANVYTETEVDNIATALAAGDTGGPICTAATPTTTWTPSVTGCAIVPATITGPQSTTVNDPGAVGSGNVEKLLTVSASGGTVTLDLSAYTLPTGLLSPPLTIASGETRDYLIWTDDSGTTWNLTSDTTDASTIASGTLQTGDLTIFQDVSATPNVHFKTTIDNIAAFTKTSLGTGADASLVTGTAGTSGNCAEWNVDGDLVDAGAACGTGGGTDITVAEAPTNVAVNSSTGGDDTIALANDTNAGVMAPAEHTKLTGIADNATANSSDATLLARANHTGTQTASTISDFASAALTAAPAETTTTTGALINGATAKTTPVDADYVGLMDSAASNILKKLSWTNIKATLKTYFDTLYYIVGGTDVSVADGGTGRSTGTTAYALVATGTTATGAQQTLASGATTAVLVGGGASALPVWTTATGTGAPVRATSPALATPNLGTPSAITLTNGTGLPGTGITWTPNDQTTSYNVVSADRGKILTCNNGTSMTITVPTASITWVNGNVIYILNKGAGPCTIAGSGVTISVASDQTLVLAQYKSATLFFTSDTTAILTGGMTGS